MNNHWHMFEPDPAKSKELSRKLGCHPSDCPVSRDVSERLVRLPFYFGMTEQEISLVLAGLENFFVGNAGQFTRLTHRDVHETVSRRAVEGTERA